MCKGKKERHIERYIDVKKRARAKQRNRGREREKQNYIKEGDKEICKLKVQNHHFFIALKIGQN